MGQAGSCTTDKVAFILSTIEYICSLNEYLVFMTFLADFRAWGHLWYLTPFHNDVLLVDGKQNRFYTESFIARQPGNSRKGTGSVISFMVIITYTYTGFALSAGLISITTDWGPDKLKLNMMIQPNMKRQILEN